MNTDRVTQLTAASTRPVFTHTTQAVPTIDAHSLGTYTSDTGTHPGVAAWLIFLVRQRVCILREGRFSYARSLSVSQLSRQ